MIPDDFLDRIAEWLFRTAPAFLADERLLEELQQLSINVFLEGRRAEREYRREALQSPRSFELRN